MSARGFRVGELVDVVIKGARVQPSAYGVHSLAVAVGARELRVPLDEDGVTVERVAPPEWPPGTGDLWRDINGSLWFVQVAEHSGGYDLRAMPAVLGADDDTALTPAELLASCGPLTLVHREAPEDDR